MFSYPVGTTGLHTLENAVRTIIARLYAGFSFPDKPVTRKQGRKTERNAEIRARYEAGEGLSDIGREYGLSPQRIYQIVRRKTG